MTFDFHSDTPAGKDPDSFSPSLRKYHQLLWSKELPTGQHFHLAIEPRRYLVHRSSSGVFFLASDTITTRLRKKARNVIRDIPQDDLPKYRGYTPGSTRSCFQATGSAENRLSMVHAGSTRGSPIASI